MYIDKFYNNLLIGDFTDQRLEPEHGRGILCSSLGNNTFASGSSDHGIRVWNRNNLKYKYELFSKFYGHKEWVTQVIHLSNDMIISGGMDGKICLWNNNEIKCKTIDAHDGSISCLIKDNKDLIASAGYDGIVKLWKSKENNITTSQLSPKLKVPIICLKIKNSLVVSGNKNGEINLWDINKDVSIYNKKIFEEGISNLIFGGINEYIIFSGGLKNGSLKGIDLRSHKIIINLNGKGGSLNYMHSLNDNQIIIAGTDKNISIIDIRKYNELFNNKKINNSIMSGNIYKDILFIGTIDGNVFVFDINQNLNSLWGFGCIKSGSVNIINIDNINEYIIISGDDNSSLVLNFKNKKK